MKARVDPRPNRPPLLGLVASANHVVNGSDDEDQGDVNRQDGYDESGTVGPRDPTAARQPASDMEQPAIGHPVRWISGFSYRPETCNGGGTMDPQGTSLPTADTPGAQIDVTPFEVAGSDKVSLFGAATAEIIAERRQYATRDLLACESKRIEAELWKGTLTTAIGSGNRFLADSNVNLVEGDRLLGWKTSLAVLEQAINDGTCGAQGMVHARADTVTFWVSEHLVHRVGNLLVTELGTIVVPGSGYDGSAPAAGTLKLDPAHAGKVPSSDSAWAYATTVVDMRRSAFHHDPSPILERVNPSSTTAATSNVLTTYVRRFAAVTWGCLQVGVHVDHTAATTITGS